MIKFILCASVILAGSAALAQTPAPVVEYNLKVSGTDVDLIGKALGSMPFNDVAPLIQKLRQQIVEQQTPPKSEVKPEQK